jgi:hypothetical protein
VVTPVVMMPVSRDVSGVQAACRIVDFLRRSAASGGRVGTAGTLARNRRLGYSVTIGQTSAFAAIWPGREAGRRRTFSAVDLVQLPKLNAPSAQALATNEVTAARALLGRRPRSGKFAEG